MRNLPEPERHTAQDVSWWDENEGPGGCGQGVLCAYQGCAFTPSYAHQPESWRSGIELDRGQQGSLNLDLEMSSGKKLMALGHLP